ncbi:MAG: hypothetical protein H6621_03520 [Halobacteriovoraceae bacterium]|nr:hypothetical protein [Halobacteriovoraceae bacterium]MCB9094117.1 hypothetical protein [Halobacteriovoraceae bacterium]
MLWKKAFSNPMLVIGILFMAIFIFQLRDKGLFQTDRFQTYSCNTVRNVLKKNIPNFWKIDCLKNNLSIVIDHMRSPYLNQIDGIVDQDQVRSFVYKDLANNLSLIAKNSPTEVLERVDIVTIRVLLPQLELNAISEGRDITPLATLENKDHIANQLHETVQVQEKWKK